MENIKENNVYVVEEHIEGLKISPKGDLYVAVFNTGRGALTRYWCETRVQSDPEWVTFRHQVGNLPPHDENNIIVGRYYISLRKGTDLQEKILELNQPAGADLEFSLEYGVKSYFHIKRRAHNWALKIKEVMEG